MREATAITTRKFKLESFAETHVSEASQVQRVRNQATDFENDLIKLDAFGLRRSFHGFYFISHYYPLRAMDEVSGESARTMIESLAGSMFEVYLHYPFCEQICTFCHFHKRVGSTESVASQEGAVVDSLISEMELNRKLLGGPIRARSLQLGGGTPSLMSTQNLSRLLEACAKNLDIQPGAEIKTEIYPKYYENESELRQRLRLLKSFGFTELVIDLESGNRATLDAINRKNSSLDAYLKLIDICISEGFTSFISALMAGLPYETYDSLYHTVDTLSAIKEINVLNVFPTIMRETDPITRQLEKDPTGYNDERTRDRMWLMARMMLHERGFVDGPISYLHRPDVRPEQQADKFECVNLIGFGPSSFGYLNGADNDWAGQYFNFCNNNDHADRIANDLPAIWRIGKYDNEERARRKVIFGMANVKAENLIDIEQQYGVSIDKIYGKTFNALISLDLIKVVPEERGIAYTQQGLARLEEISYFLYSKFAKDRSDELPRFGEPHYTALINQHYTVTMAPEDRKLFETFEASMPDAFMWRIHQDTGIQA